ncbi:dihydrofolate reductase family protein [Arthrobacter methylotrophus]|uniref:Dihydrofolate reductase family protein n=1 Tax=Arthrobacter methylotrophus TaxID=121291 RepID=A0ABV5UWA6_9MICC
MAKLIYTGIMSLDGYTADAAGKFDWSMPDEEVHSFVNDLERPVGTYLLGRRMYEVMAVWEDMSLSQEPPVIRDYAEIWRAADKIVYSTSLESPSTARTRIEREFDAGAIRALKETAPRDMSIGGTTLAAQAIKAGLVDEFRLFLTPVVVGGGKQYLPDDVRITLELLDEHRFGNGVVYLRYAKGDE